MMLRWLWRVLAVVVCLGATWIGMSWWFSNATPGQYRRFFNVIYRYPMGAFARAPNRLLVQTALELKPGKALDVAMGEGRNAVFLASRGWDVTGFDVSDEALKQAIERARTNNVELRLMRESSEDFPYGHEQWDLILFSYAFAPIEDPAYVKRIELSLKPGGLVVFEHYLQVPGVRPIPGSPKRGELPKLFQNFDMKRYEETTTAGDWQFGKTAPLVRMVAMKR